MTKNNLNVVKSTKDQEMDVKEKNKAVDAAIAQISLASSEKNYLMAQYNLLKAVGLLNSQYLKLK